MDVRLSNGVDAFPSWGKASVSELIQFFEIEEILGLGDSEIMRFRDYEILELRDSGIARLGDWGIGGLISFTSLCV